MELPGTIGIKLAYAPYDKCGYGGSSEPPVGGDVFYKAGSYEQYESCQIEDDGQCFHSIIYF